MTRIRRVTTAAAMVCMIAAQCGTLFASDEQHAAPPTPASHLTFNGEPLATLGVLDADRPPQLRGSAPLASVDSNVLSQRGGFGRGRGRGRNDGATAAIVFGAIGTIAGAAVLVYAGRPECNANPNLGGCGYGTKVVGGAVLTAGLVGLMVGALTWR